MFALSATSGTTLYVLFVRSLILKLWFNMYGNVFSKADSILVECICLVMFCFQTMYV